MNVNSVGAPGIEPVEGGLPRPLWSVMIPTFNCARFLKQTLESVLSEGIDSGCMQIEVVDDCSTKDDPESVVRDYGRGRVAFHRKERNGGAINNFNTCIQRSRGHLVHILHGDDYVLPGFYARTAEVAEKYPDCGGIFVRSFVVSEAGELEAMSGRVKAMEAPCREAGVLFYDNRIMTPGVVVRRTQYELNGGFLPSLVHVADWEMWIRVVATGGGILINSPLAAYRMFEGNDTGRLAKSAENLRDFMRLADECERHFKGFDRRRFTDIVLGKARQQAARFRRMGDHESATNNEGLIKELRTDGSVLTRLWRAMRAARREY